MSRKLTEKEVKEKLKISSILRDGFEKQKKLSQLDFWESKGMKVSKWFEARINKHMEHYRGNFRSCSLKDGDKWVWKYNVCKYCYDEGEIQIMMQGSRSAAKNHWFKVHENNNNNNNIKGGYEIIHNDDDEIKVEDDSYSQLMDIILAMKIKYGIDLVGFAEFKQFITVLNGKSFPDQILKDELLNEKKIDKEKNKYIGNAQKKYLEKKIEPNSVVDVYIKDDVLNNDCIFLVFVAGVYLYILPV